MHTYSLNIVKDGRHWGRVEFGSITYEDAVKRACAMKNAMLAMGAFAFTLIHTPPQISYQEEL